MTRYVTGFDANGHSVFAHEDDLQPFTSPLVPGVSWQLISASDDTPLVGDTHDGGWSSFFPPVGGHRALIFTMPPASRIVRTAPVEGVDAARAALDSRLPGLLSTLESMDHGAAGMHATATIDVSIVLEGSITIALDGGESRALMPGDVLVQNGTAHRWLNESDSPAVLATFMLGAVERTDTVDLGPRLTST